MYAWLRDQSDFTLVIRSLADTSDPVVGYFAKAEIGRRVQSGETDGTDALFLTLQFAYSDQGYSKEALNLADELLALGIDLNSSSPYGGTMLHRAVLTNQPEIVAYLLERCADPSVSLTGEGMLSQQRNALEYAYYVARTIEDTDYTRVIETLENPYLTENCVYH